jgi:transcriptional regulator with XRE-family HTH domain
MSKQIRPKRLAEKLLAIRQRLALSQSQLAKRINPQMHYGRVSEYELGKRQPPIVVLLAYARVASIPLENIIDDKINLEF